MRHLPSPAQIRAARAMLDWSIVELARAARVSVVTVQEAEGRGQRPASPEKRTLIDEALARAGVVFLPDDGGGAGLRARPDAPHRGSASRAGGIGE